MGGMEDWAWLQLALRVLTRSRLLINTFRPLIFHLCLLSISFFFLGDINSLDLVNTLRANCRNVLAFERGGFEFGQ
jgi:hypothetical protein